MKKIFYLLMASLALIAVSCDPDKKQQRVEVSVQLVKDGENFAEAGPLTGQSTTFEAETNAAGCAMFTVTVGVYSASTSFKKSIDGILLNYNGSVAVAAVAGGENVYSLNLTESKTSQLIIKELYNGGSTSEVVQEDGTTKSVSFQNDKYIIVYNNSDTEVDASRMGLAMAQISPIKVAATYPIDEEGVIQYEKEGWTPASYAIWWFQNGTQVKIAPYSQIVISIQGAVDNTQTYPASVDLSHADYCLYDLETSFVNPAHYPAPSANIPESHYMKTFVFGTGNAWPFPNLSATPFLLIPDEGTDLQEFVKNAGNYSNLGSNLSTNFVKIPSEWVLDGLEIWGNTNESTNFLRLPSQVNVGYKVLTNKLGYSTYRNVDKAATEAIEGNKGLLVYNYSGAVNADDTDPSGIDAEASIAAGAKIVYMDTNNSVKDFHIRKVASIKK